MGEPAVLGRAVPVLHLGGNGDHIAGQKLSRLLPPRLIPAPAPGAEQDLPAAPGGVMDVPVVPAARLKGHVGHEYRFLGVGQGLEVAVAYKILGKRLIGLAQAK